MTVACHVYILGENKSYERRFLTVPSVGDYVSIPRLERVESFEVTQVWHFAEGASANDAGPTIQLHVRAS